MTETTPDYAGLIERLRKPGTWARHGDDIIASDAKEELVRDDAPFEAATALRTLLESNKELEREQDQLLDKLHCMCGSPIDHSAWEGHTPVSVYDYSLDRERSRAEAAEAERDRLKERVVELEKALEQWPLDDDELETIEFLANTDQRKKITPWEISALLAVYRTARKLLKENGNGE